MSSIANLVTRATLVGLVACGGSSSNPGMDAPGGDAAAIDAAGSAAGDAAIDTAIDAAVDAAVIPCVPPSPNTAPTYTELFTKYFAPGTPGHCANENCHAGSNYNIWLCGTNRDSCFAGMVGLDLINPANPTASRIADPMRSPLAWFTPLGRMPYDNRQPFEEGRAAIAAWVAACALDN